MTPDDLVGDWAFKRLIHDRREGPRIPVAGTAHFERLGTDLIEWVEHGSMWLGSDEVAVAATRLLERGADGSWAANFADGRGFHDWRWDAGLVHDCAPDVYRGLLRTVGPGWSMRWAAAGPAKDYVIETQYSRKA